MLFKQRYHINQIVEFYGATEANIFTFNPVGKIGAVGYIPRICDVIYPAFLVRPHNDNDDDDDGDVSRNTAVVGNTSSMPYRDRHGHCVCVSVDEVGMLICLIQDQGERTFEGYTDKKATESKILR